MTVEIYKQYQFWSHNRIIKVEFIIRDSDPFEPILIFKALLKYRD